MGNETMAMLAENYQTGILVCSAIVWLIYIALVVLSIVLQYKRTGKYKIMGVIPIIHIALLFTGKKKPKKVDEDQESFDDIF